MMNQSNIAKQLFKLLTGKAPRRKSKVRWGTEYLVAENLTQNFPYVAELLASEAVFVAEELRADLMLINVDTLVPVNEAVENVGAVVVGNNINNNILTTIETFHLLQLEMALVVDLGKPLYELVYLFNLNETDL